MLQSMCLRVICIGAGRDENTDRGFGILRHSRSGQDAEHAQEDCVYLDTAGEAESAQVGPEIPCVRQGAQTVHRIALIRSLHRPIHTPPRHRKSEIFKLTMCPYCARIVAPKGHNEVTCEAFQTR